MANKGPFSKPILAIVKSAIAELYTHTKMDLLFETYGFEKPEYADVSNKERRASSYIDRQNWDDPKVTEMLSQLLAQVFLENQQLLTLTEKGYSSNPITMMERLNRTLVEGGFKWNGKTLDYLSQSQMSELKPSQKVDMRSIEIEVTRARENLSKDPADALTAAENILAATCKGILFERKVEWGAADSPMELLRHVMGALEILPEKISAEAKGADSIKKVLRSMVATTQGMAELRNLYGDSHGKEPQFKGLQPRHARLMVNVSEALSIFFMETHLEKRG